MNQQQQTNQADLKILNEASQRHANEATELTKKYKPLNDFIFKYTPLWIAGPLVGLIDWYKFKQIKK